MDPRLPEGVRPIAVTLTLDIDPRREDFSGEARIQLELAQTTTRLRLNATELDIDRIDIDHGSLTQSGSSVRIDDDVVELRFAEPIAAGKANLHLTYRGRMDSTRSRGIYRVQEPDGQWYAYTFFEPVDARRAFPGFDQPDAKIPWTLSIRTHGDDVAAANTEVTSLVDMDGGKLHRFAPTRPLPSYLLAFMVGPFDIIDGGRAGHAGVPIRFVVPPGHRAELRYALEATPRAVDSLESFFGTAFPYPKLDVAVVPRYWGTMEHPGLVAMGQPLSLIQPHEETPGRHQAYSNILIHELAHYWFGDLVTMKWWDDIWLNESLATWADTRVTHAFAPDWQWDMQWGGYSASAMAADAQEHVSPLRRHVATRGDIDASMENAITYYKGASILRMMETSMGVDQFHEALRGYFAVHADANADTNDFMAAMTKTATPAQIASLRSFIDQPGVPLLKAQLDCSGDGPRLKLQQERFLDSGPGAAVGARWQIPVCARYGRGDRIERSCTFLSEAEGTLALAPDLGCPDWWIANDDAAGYYRVDYGDGFAPGLFTNPAINALERRALASDIGALALAGYADAAPALDLIPILARSDDPTMPRAASRLLLNLVHDDQLDAVQRDQLQGFVRAHFSARAHTIGWVPAAKDSQDVRNLRQSILYVAGVTGEDPVVRRQALAQTRAWLSDRGSVDADLAYTALMISAIAGDPDVVDAMFTEALSTGDRDNRESLFYALGHVADAAQLQRALAIVLDPAFDVRESIGILFSAMGDTRNFRPALRFLKSNFEALMPRLRDDEKIWLIESIGAGCDDAVKGEVDGFLAPHIDTIKGGAHALRKALHEISTCSAQWRRNRDDVLQFLDAHQPH